MNMSKPLLTPCFSGGIEVETYGFMYQVRMKIAHKTTGITVAVNESLFADEKAYLNAFEQFLEDYFFDESLFCLARLTVIRGIPLNIQCEDFSSVCDELLMALGV